jgi:hypothetical protein
VFWSACRPVTIYSASMWPSYPYHVQYYIHPTIPSKWWAVPVQCDVYSLRSPHFKSSHFGITCDLWLGAITPPGLPPLFPCPWKIPWSVGSSDHPLVVAYTWQRLPQHKAFWTKLSLSVPGFSILLHGPHDSTNLLSCFSSSVSSWISSHHIS